MKCINCYREIGDDNKFCTFCGTMQPLDREAYEREHPEIATAISDDEMNLLAQNNSVPQEPPVPDDVNTPAGNMIQCPECGGLAPADSAFCPHCRCPFATPDQQHHNSTALIISPSNLPVVPKDKNNDQRPPLPPKRSGMSGWAKALLTVSILMLLGVIGGGVYYFFFYNKVTKLRPDEEEVTFSRKGGEKTVTVTTDAKKIEVSKKPDWVSVTVGDGEITIKCQPLESYEDREGVVKLKAGDKNAKITVKQSANATYLRLSQDLIRIGHNNENLTIDLDTDGDPSTLDFEIDDYFMCSLSGKSSTGFTATVEENNSSSPRECKITIGSGNQKETLTIIQAGKCAYCGGTGKEHCYYCDGDGRNICSNCNGLGKVYDWWGDESQCDRCDGRGYFSCENCNGQGYNTCGYCNGTGNNFSREEI